MQNTLSRRAAAVTAATTGLVLSAPVMAFAQTTPVEDANTAVTSAASDATSIIQTGIPLVLGVAVAWVALKFGKRLIGKL